MASKRKIAKPPKNPGDAPTRRKTNTETQFSVRVTPDVVRQLDEAVERAGFGSRVVVLRKAIEIGMPILLERIGKP